MINIKSAPGSTDDSGPSRKSLEFKDPETSRAPLAIAAFLAGLLVYFRTLTSAPTANSAAPIDSDEPRPAVPAPERLASAPDVEGDDKRQGRERETNEEARRPVTSGDYGRSSLLVEDEPFDYRRISDRPLRPESLTPVRPRPANDNPAPVAGDGAKVAGGGGGGGGGGDNPRNTGETRSRLNDPDLEPRGNRAPRVQGPVQLQDAIQCRATTIPIALLLAGASDLDGDALTILEIRASAGTIERTSDEFVYTPAEGYIGEVRLVYLISDGTEAVIQIADFDVVHAPPTIGTSGGDVLIGTACGDEIDGLEGDDEIDAGGGNDVVVGGPGNDIIDAGAGDDVIDAGPGNDIVYAGAGDDVVYGRAGNDIIFGGPGDDRLSGGEGDDLIDAGEGNDLVLAGAGNDHVLGSDGDDVLYGDDGRDVLDGGAGDDEIDGGPGADILLDGVGTDRVIGGPDDDTVVAAPDGANDTFTGDAGFDTLSYAESTEDVLIDAIAGCATGVSTGSDVFSDFEKIVGGSGDDTFVASIIEGGDFVLQGGPGDDTFEFVEVAPLTPREPADRVHEILDLEVGDRILVRAYEIRTTDDEASPSGADDATADAFADAYDATDRRPFRFRSEKRDDGDYTIIEVNDCSDDPEQPDGMVVWTIDVQGNHRFQFIEIG